MEKENYKMTTYKSYTINKTSTTVDASLHNGRGNRYLLKITDRNGHAIRNANGNLPIITTIIEAKNLINEELSK